MNIIKKSMVTIISLMLVCTLGGVCFASGDFVIDSVSFENYFDNQGVKDEDYVNVRISYTAPENTEQIYFVIASENVDITIEGSEEKIIHMDQSPYGNDGEYVCTVAKSKIYHATGLDDIEGETLFVKMTAKGIPGYASFEAVYNDPALTVAFGDVNNDGEVNVGDAIQILRYEAGSITLSEEQVFAGDLNNDGTADVGDAIRILRFEAGIIDSLK